MCEDINIFDQNFTTMQLLSIFCKVNIDDDLYEKEDDDDDEADSAELVFDEFEEVSSSGSTRTLTLHFSHSHSLFAFAHRWSRASSTRPSSNR